jgi:two-component sensor histidine kinase
MPTPLPLHPDAALGLALALIASSTAPLVLLDGELTVVAVSRSFCQAFGVDLASAPTRSIFELGAGEWDVRELRSLLTAVIDGRTDIDADEMDLKPPGGETRRLVIGAHKLDYAEVDGVRIALSVADVTEVRLTEKHKDELLREKAILLEELQHRIANSLQIIASVLLQSASRVTSDEVRSHLYDAHNRVMSVAALQKQLTATRLGGVGVRAYFADLCGSISASMIPDPRRLSLDVDVDESVASSNVSVSLGLIVTELVINALKHAFPGHRRGKIERDSFRRNHSRSLRGSWRTRLA